MSHVQPPLPFPTYAPIIEAEPNGHSGAVIVTILCPLCDQRHTHGIPAGDLPDFEDTYGGRVPHCVHRNNSGQYVLHDINHLVRPAQWLGQQGGRA